MDQPVNRIMENDDNQQYQKQTEGTSNTTIQVKTNLQYQNLCLAHSDEIQVATDLPILPRSIATSQSPSSELPTVPFTVTSEQFTDDELLEPPDPPNTPLGYKITFSNSSKNVCQLFVLRNTNIF